MKEVRFLLTEFCVGGNCGGMYNVHHSTTGDVAVYGVFEAW